MSADKAEGQIGKKEGGVESKEGSGWGLTGKISIEGKTKIKNRNDGEEIKCMKQDEKQRKEGKEEIKAVRSREGQEKEKKKEKHGGR